MAAKTTTIHIDNLEGGFLIGYEQETDEGVGSYTREIVVTERKLLDKIKSLLKSEATDEATDEADKKAAVKADKKAST